MTNKQIANNLQIIYDKILKDINPAKFNFRTFVTSFKKDKEGHICGTVCCVLGYFPMKFPNSGIIYQLQEDDSVELTLTFDEDCTTDDIKVHVSELVGCDLKWVEYLFYGENCEELKRENFPELSLRSSLKEVRKAWLGTIEYFNQKEDLSYTDNTYNLN
jgi:hypothetical protein